MNYFYDMSIWWLWFTSLWVSLSVNHFVIFLVKGKRHGWKKVHWLLSVLFVLFPPVFLAWHMLKGVVDMYESLD